MKALAREHGLRIIDSAVTDDRSDECEDPPKLTKVGEPAGVAEMAPPKADSAAEPAEQPANGAPKRRGRPAKAGG